MQQKNCFLHLWRFISISKDSQFVLLSVMSIRVLKGIPSRMNIATPPPREFRSFPTTEYPGMVISASVTLGLSQVSETVKTSKVLSLRRRRMESILCVMLRTLRWEILKPRIVGRFVDCVTVGPGFKDTSLDKQIIIIA